mmetsp:Transcript_129988/g.225951  ORF Transcript_129988/g.225951 Transcript_129988/m.225951 type:complete len:120 (-) Transcript_129988:658-1017(-)
MTTALPGALGGRNSIFIDATGLGGRFTDATGLGERTRLGDVAGDTIASLEMAIQEVTGALTVVFDSEAFNERTGAVTELAGAVTELAGADTEAIVCCNVVLECCQDGRLGLCGVGVAGI